MPKPARAAAAAEKSAGKTLEETRVAGPMAPLGEKWGKDHPKPDNLVRTIRETPP